MKRRERKKKGMSNKETTNYSVKPVFTNPSNFGVEGTKSTSNYTTNVSVTNNAASGSCTKHIGNSSINVSGSVGKGGYWNAQITFGTKF